MLVWHLLHFEQKVQIYWKWQQNNRKRAKELLLHLVALSNLLSNWNGDNKEFSWSIVSHIKTQFIYHYFKKSTGLTKFCWYHGQRKRMEGDDTGKTKHHQRIFTLLKLHDHWNNRNQTKLRRTRREWQFYYRVTVFELESKIPNPNNADATLIDRFWR